MQDTAARSAGVDHGQRWAGGRPMSATSATLTGNDQSMASTWGT